MRRITMIGVLVLAALAVAAYLGIGPTPAGGTFTLNQILHPPWPLATNPRVATTELCDGLEGCMEVYRTDQADYYRFERHDQAVALTESIDAEHAVSDRFVAVVFTDEDLVAGDRVEIMEAVTGAHSSE